MGIFECHWPLQCPVQHTYQAKFEVINLEFCWNAKYLSTCVLHDKLDLFTKISLGFPPDSLWKPPPDKGLAEDAPRHNVWCEVSTFCFYTMHQWWFTMHLVKTSLCRLISPPMVGGTVPPPTHQPGKSSVFSSRRLWTNKFPWYRLGLQITRNIQLCRNSCSSSMYRKARYSNPTHI